MKKLQLRQQLYNTLLLIFFSLLISTTILADDTFNSLTNKRSYLTYEGIGYVGQELDGFWWFVSNRKKNLYHMQFFNNKRNLAIHTGDNAKMQPWYKEGTRFPINHYSDGVNSQFAYAENRCFKGISSTIEKRYPNVPPKCPQYKWWSKSQICFNKKHMDAEETIFSKHHDRQSCQFNNSPNTLKFKYERFLGASFAPFIPGRYIHRFQTLGHYELAVKFAWDYSGVRQAFMEPTRVKVQIKGSHMLIANGPISGNYTFRTPNPGRYVFVVDVFNNRDQLIHRDFLTAIIPNI